VVVVAVPGHLVAELAFTAKVLRAQDQQQEQHQPTHQLVVLVAGQVYNTPAVAQAPLDLLAAPLAEVGVEPTQCQAVAADWGGKTTSQWFLDKNTPW
jgi:hypothetical protein